MAFGSYAGLYPGGTWTDDGSAGALQWSIVQGAIIGPNDPEQVNLGLNSMIAALVSIDDLNEANWSFASELGSGILASKQHAVKFNNTTGDIDIRTSPASAGGVAWGAHILAQSFTLIVFHQGT
jgi:hypothetical protein